MSTIGKVIAVVTTTLALSGCGLVHFGKIEECQSPVIPQLSVPTIQELKLQSIDWIVVTPENAAKVFEELKKKGIDQAVFAVTDEGYMALSTNMEKVQGHIHQQRIVIDEYKSFQTKVQKAVEEASQTKSLKGSKE